MLQVQVKQLVGLLVGIDIKITKIKIVKTFYYFFLLCYTYDRIVFSEWMCKNEKE